MVKRLKPTPEQFTQPNNIFVLEETIKAGKFRLRNRASSVYERYYARAEINKPMYDAASRYYNAYYLGHERTTIIPKYGERIGSGSVRTLFCTEYQERKREEYENARASLPRRLRNFVDDVIIYDVDTRSAAKTLERKPVSGFDLFCECLYVLSDFFLGEGYHSKTNEERIKQKYK